MAVGAALLRQARRSQRLSQRAFGERAHVPQPALAATESGAHDPQVGTLDRWLTPAGFRLAVLPTRSRTAAEVADLVYDSLRHGREDRAFREVVQLSDDLTREDRPLRSALTVTPPPLVGDPRYDALIAGVVEHHLRTSRLPLPAWLGEPERRLTEPWLVDDEPAFAEETRQSTPPSLARHGVWLAASELASV